VQASGRLNREGEAGRSMSGYTGVYTREGAEWMVVAAQVTRAAAQRPHPRSLQSRRGTTPLRGRSRRWLEH
jgi:hypothetical protein